MALGIVQTAQAEKLDLRQCIAQALAQNPSLMASASRIEQAQAAIDRSKSSYLPKISTSITASRSNDPLNVFGMKLMQQNASFNDFGAADFLQNQNPAQKPDNLNKPGDYSNINTRIQAEMPIYTGGQIDAYVRQAQGFLAAAQAGDVAARQQLMFMVFQAYEGVNTAGAFVEVAEQGVKATQPQLTLPPVRLSKLNHCQQVIAFAMTVIELTFRSTHTAKIKTNNQGGQLCTRLGDSLYHLVMETTAM